MDEGREIGVQALCDACGEPILWQGLYWDHIGENKPRHPAVPAGIQVPQQAKEGSSPYPHHWTETFAGRELEEIKFARTYHQRFGHGTPGHLHLLLISQLSRQVDILMGRDPDWDRASW